MRKLVYTWRDTLTRLGFRWKRHKKAEKSKTRTLRLESLAQREMLTGDLPCVLISSVQDPAEDGLDGYFRLSRTGSTDNSLTVSYYIDTGNSTATNGTDVSYLNGTYDYSNYGYVTFQAGQSTVDIAVHAIDDSSVEGNETLRIQLSSGCCYCGGGSYTLGSPNSATLSITDNDAQNTPPTISVPASQQVNEDAVLNISTIVVDDAQSATLEVDLAVGHGILMLGTTAGLTFVESTQNGAAVLKIQGSKDSLNASLATLSYCGQADYNGQDMLSVIVSDLSVSDGPLTTTGQVAITVGPVNAAPVLTPAAPNLGTTNEDTAIVLSLSSLATAISDVDAGAVIGGIALTSTTGHGTWTYSLDAGTTWTAVGTVSTASALLLPQDAQLRYQPDGQLGETATVGYCAWDTTSGSAGARADLSAIGATGGTTAFSAASDTASLSVTDVNDAPVLTGIASATLDYTENQTPTAIASSLVVSDVDSATLTSATVSLSANYQSGEDVLAADTTGTGLVASFDVPTGVLTISGSGPLADYQQVLRTVTYQNTSENPATATRTVSFQVNDGAVDSDLVTRPIAVSAVNDAPVLSLEAGAITYTENEAAVAVAVTLEASDADHAMLAGATVAIGANFLAGADVLEVTTTGTNITASYDSATGVLSLSGTDTVAAYQQVLRSVTYQNTSENPSTATRTVIFEVSDGVSESALATRQITVVAVNDAPVAEAGGPYTVAEDGTVTLDASGSTDPDGTIASYVWDLDGDGLYGETGLDALRGDETGLQPTFSALGLDGSQTCIVSLRVTDNDGASTTGTVSITITEVNDAPVRTAGTVASLRLDDAASTTSLGLADLTYSAGGGADEATQTLSYAVTEVPATALGTIVLADGVTVVVPGSYTLEQLRGMQFVPAASANGIGVFRFTVTDDGTTAGQPDPQTLVESLTISVGVVNLSFDKTVAEDTLLPFTAEDFASHFIGPNSQGTLQSVTITALPSHGTLLLSGSPVALNDEISVSALSNLTYQGTADYAGTDALTWIGSDGTSYASSAATVTLNVTPVDDAPEIVGGDQTFALAENSPAGTLVGTILASDPDLPAQTLTYSLVAGNDGGVFTINGDGQLTVADSSLLDYETHPSFVLTVRVTDSSTQAIFDEATVTVNLTNASEAPALQNVEKALLSGSELSFTAADFTSAFSDQDGDSLVQIQITSLPEHGELVRGTVAVALGDEIAAGDLGPLVYRPTAGYRGPDSFGWNASDGTLYAAAGATVLIAVVGVDDSYSVAEGGSVVLSGCPGLSSTSLAFAWDLDGDGVFGEMGASAALGDETGIQPTFSTAGLDGPSTVTVQLRVTDALGTVTTDAATIEITNTAPTLALSGASSVNEGSLYELTLGSVTDPGQDTVSQYQIDWGDGHTSTIAAIDLPSNRVVTHAYADGEASGTLRTIQVNLVDEDGTYTAVATKAVTVHNVAPTLAAIAEQAVPEGGVISLTDLGVFTDPGFDDPSGNPATSETFTYTINWGDNTELTTGTATIDTLGQPGVLTAGSFDGSHTYTTGGVYTVLVTVTDDDGASSTQSFLIRYQLPTAPTALTATGASNTQVSLSWTDNSDCEFGFVVEKSVDGTTFGFAGWADADTTSCTVTGLTPGTSYWFRVVAYNNVGSASSSAVSATTTANLPLAPTNLAATAVRGSQVELAWSVNTSSEQDGFRIEMSTDGTSYTQVATASGSSTKATIDNLSPRTRYYFRVKAYNAVGESETASNVLRLSTTVDLPEAPTNLAATAVSASQVTLTWTNGSTNQEGFTIERSTDGLTFILVAAAEESGYTVENLAPGTTYFFRIRAFNITGKSAYSNTASATTTAASAVPTAPSSLWASAASDVAEITLTWHDNSNNESGFAIERSTDGQTFTQVATTSVNVTSWTATELLPATLYYFRVRAYNGVGDSTYSGTASAWTANVAVPPTVSTDAAISLNATQTVATLSVLGDDDEGETSLTYTWAATMLPPGATAPEFSTSGTNAAKNTTATLNAAGTYWFTVTITDQDGLSTTSSIMITVDAIPQSITIDPASVGLAAGAKQQFTATALDQFGDALVMPMLTWSATAGTIDNAGLYTAPAGTTTATITVAVGGVSATSSVTVTNAAPTIATQAAASQDSAAATISLSVLGADDAGEAGLTYTWVALVMPGYATATFSDTNGTNNGKELTVTVDTLGTYRFLVTAADQGGLTVASTVEITVVQTLTTIIVTPASTSVEVVESVQFSATGYDQ